MEDSILRQEVHQEIIRCLEKAGMIGGGDSDEGSEENVDSQEEEDDDNKAEGTPATDEDWDYSFNDIAKFLAGFPAHTKVDMDDEWDEVFRPLDGTAHFSIATKMNHSCDPNVILLYKTRGWGKDHPLVAYCVALKNIAEGEELTICYIDGTEEVEKRQAALANYGFSCNCAKCERELNSSLSKEKEHDGNGDVLGDDPFGSDDDEESIQENAEELQQDRVIDAAKTDDLQSGDDELLQMAEQINSVLNRSLHGAVPVSHLASVSNYVVRTAKAVQTEYDDDEKSNDSATLKKLLQECANAVQKRDFASCRIVGADLEIVLFDCLQKKGSFENLSQRAMYWCAAVTASIGFAHDGAFLVAMQYLDKGVILGVNRQEFPGFFCYVEKFAAQMAQGPCPVAIQCQIPNFEEPQHQENLRSKGLSKHIEFPVEEIEFDLARIRQAVASREPLGPFVIRGLASEWPSISKWREMGTLAKEHQNRLVPIEIGGMADGGSMQESIVSFRHFVDTYLSESAKKDWWSLQDAISTENAPKIGYLAQHPLLDQIPVLNNDVDRTPCGIKPEKVNVWMGTGGTRTPLHYDSFDNFLVQVVGAKYVRLYAREDTAKLYVSTNKTYGLQGNMSDLDCEMEDFEKHPLARDCPYQEVLLLPGDCLFIPARHWHYVRSLTTSVSVNYWF